jgi:hypothetical protein
VPPDASSYTTFHVVGDLVALIAELGQPQVRRTNPFKNCSNPGARLLIPH